MTLICLGTTIGYFVSVVDTCVHPTATYTSSEYIDMSGLLHDGFDNLNIVVSVTSGSIVLKQNPSLDNAIQVEVIRGSSSQENIEAYTSFRYDYNDTHLSLIGETPTALFDCPTVQIIVTIPEITATSHWFLSVETGKISIESFYGYQSDLFVAVTTGSVHLGEIFARSLDANTNAGAVFWEEQASSSEVLYAKIATNSGYVSITGIGSVTKSGELAVITNTGVISLKDVTPARMVVDCMWGVIRAKNSGGLATFINSDSAHVCLTNDWENTVVEMTTESGTVNLDDLTDQYTFGYESSDNTVKLWLNDEENPTETRFFYLRTVSGTVSLKV